MRAYSLLMLLWALPGCAPGLNAPERFEGLECDYDVPRDLLAPRCGISSCHAPLEPEAGLDLFSGGVVERLVGVESTTCAGRSRIDPEAPSESFLLHIISPEASCGSERLAPMPRVGEPLTEAERTCVGRWVESVAASPAARVAEPTDAGL